MKYRAALRNGSRTSIEAYRAARNNAINFLTVKPKQAYSQSTQQGRALYD